MNDEHTLDPQAFDDILAECVDAVLSGEKTIDACIAAHPQAQRELRPLLQTALLTAQLTAPQMDSARADVLEGKLRGYMAKHAPQATPIEAESPKIIRLNPLRRMSRTAAAVLLMVMILIGGTGGMVAASSDSVPGDTLYGVKRTWESIIMLIASLTGQLDDVWIEIAETRLEEVKALEARGELTPDRLSGLAYATEQAIAHNETLSQPLHDYLLETQRLLSTQDWRTEPAAQAILVDISTSLDMPPEAGQETPPSEAVEPLVEQTPETLALSPTPSMTPVPATATTEPTVEPAAVVTEEPTATVIVVTATDIPPSATPTASATPRIPPTPTRTPTLGPTVTLTATPTMIPSATWTPLPLPTQGVPPTAPVILPPGQPSPTQAPREILPTATWYPWVQATYDSCLATRDVDPDAYRNDPNCP